MSDSPASGFSIPSVLPLLPVRDAVVFPSMILPLFVGRDLSAHAVESALESDRLIVLAAQRDPEVEDPGPDDLYGVGMVGMIMRLMQLPEGRLKVLVQGLTRVRIKQVLRTEPHIDVEVEEIPAEVPQPFCVETEALIRSVRAKVEELLAQKHLPPEIVSVVSGVDDPGRMADLVAANLRLRVDEAQEVLEIDDGVRRLRRIDAVLRRELAVGNVQAEIQTAAREELTRGQREQFLREQMRAIQHELGESDEHASWLEELRRRVLAAGMNDEARTEAERQLDRLVRMHPDSSETQVVRTYLDWMVELPWSKAASDGVDLRHACAILERDHAHLDRVKERVLEFLAVHKLRGEQGTRGPILCLVGPPGVGKTSLGRSVAAAMGRKFVRISLGGLRDEAEIRGHRRTYVGALPGRILQGMRQAGEINPVFMLDEVDKLGADYRGDPAAALLEVLDPEQNAQFRDHYLGVPYDLSKVLFIGTANLVEPIPRALLDRVEVIRLSGYTPEEKEVIGRRFLVPRQIEQCGLRPEQVKISPAAVRDVITRYTQEAGVRSLEREIARAVRKVARRVAEDSATAVSITAGNLREFLGTPPRLDSGVPRKEEVGLARGLAWTETGGEVLLVEASMVRGRGLIMTGHLGEVMKESGRAALSWVRSHADELGIKDLLAHHEIHLHVPAGATPKDGPSAGVTMATALVSLLRGVPVRADVAMTGEITLRGRVLPVGGVREKALGALRRGIRTIIVPEANEPDLDEIPADLRRQIRFRPVATMDEVLALALVRTVARPRRTPGRASRSRAAQV